MLKNNYSKKFDKFPWEKNSKFLYAWKKGLTGYPIVDAGMRELYSTGWMHNRVRMIVGSFLVKHLLIDWKEGEKYFRNCLLDYSPASNVAGGNGLLGAVQMLHLILEYLIQFCRVKNLIKKGNM